MTSSDTTPATAFAALLETALDAWLALDPEAAAGLEAIAGRIIALELVGLGQTFYFLPTDCRVEVLARYEGEPDTLIRGTPIALARMSLGEAGEGLFGEGVEIRGDTETGHRFQRVLAAVEFDWEEQAAKLLGDTAAHQLGRALRGLRGWAGHVAATLEQDLGEYLREEIRLLPARPEVEDFMAEVDRTREDCDRLEARIRRLEARLDGGD